MSSDATQEEIDRSFWRLAKKYHPDVNPDRREWAEEKFKRISDAYSIIGNRERRKKYDLIYGSTIARKKEKEDVESFHLDVDIEEIYSELFTSDGVPRNRGTFEDLARLDPRMKVRSKSVGRIPYRGGHGTYSSYKRKEKKTVKEKIIYVHPDSSHLYPMTYRSDDIDEGRTIPIFILPIIFFIVILIITAVSGLNSIGYISDTMTVSIVAISILAAILGVVVFYIMR